MPSAAISALSLLQGTAHALVGLLAATYHLHHGLGVAVLLPATLSFNAPAIPAMRWESLCGALGLPTQTQPEDLAQWSRAFLRALGLPVKLAEVGLRRSDIPQIAQDATRMAMFSNNIRPATVEELTVLLEANL